MNQKDKNFKFEESLNINSDIETFKSPNQRVKLKLKIMDKFNIDSNEAEKVLLEIEKRENITSSQTEISNKNHVKMIKKDQIPNSNYHSNFHSKNHVMDNIPKNINNNLKLDSVKDSDFDVKSKIANENQNSLKNQVNTQKPEVKMEKQDSIKNDEYSITKKNPQKNQHLENVDSILEDIIPNYNKQISISVNHVDLTFEVQNEKVDTLKETFIRTLKRNKTKKIKIHALKDISFNIYKGEKVGIIGYNGAGKSTLLNVITGIFPPDTGEVTTFGNISPLLSLGAGFDYNFSGRKNIILNGAVLGYDKEFLESKMDEIIEFSELGKFIDIPIKNYSSGMIAKLGFSIATAVEPDILIIDEILAVGDVTFNKKSGDKIRSLMDGGTTVLLVSHSIPQIRELCDKAIWIDNGKLREIGDVNKVCDNYIKDSEKASNEQLANIQFR